MMEKSEARFHNIRVASRVMGWTQWRIEDGEDCPCEPGVTYFADWGGMGGLAIYTPPHLTGDVEYYFNPAEDIADAWKVIEKFAAVTDTRLRYWFTVRLRWAIEDRIGVYCSEAVVILHVQPQDICIAAVHAIERDGAEALREIEAQLA